MQLMPLLGQQRLVFFSFAVYVQAVAVLCTPLESTDIKQESEAVMLLAHISDVSGLYSVCRMSTINFLYRDFSQCLQMGSGLP
jgi:hypothetical protein